MGPGGGGPGGATRAYRSPAPASPDQHPLTHTQLGRAINGTRVPETLEVTARHLSEAPPGQDLPLWPLILPDS